MEKLTLLYHTTCPTHNTFSSMVECFSNIRLWQG